MKHVYAPYSIASYNPPPEFINMLRLTNVAIGFIAVVVLFLWLARSRWAEWDVPTRLSWMSLVMLCFTGTYGTYEVQYLNTYFRVPMVTVSLLWAILAAAWPKDGTCLWSRRK